MTGWPTFEVLEKYIILEYLKHFNYNMTKTSGTLKIGRVTLYRKCEKYGIKIERTGTCQKEQ